jgi:hypothetical protein
VLASQGNPTSTDERTEQKWFYGESWVQFIDTYYGDEVMGWDNSGGNLNLAVTTNNTVFTFGSSRVEVLASQGNPTSTDERTEQKWFYGESWVQFIDTYYGDEVMGWDNSGGNLRLK